MCLFDELVGKDFLGSPGRCPDCGAFLHVDTGSILDFEEGLIPGPVFFCTECGFDSSVAAVPPAA